MRGWVGGLAMVSWREILKKKQIHSQTLARQTVKTISTAEGHVLCQTCKNFTTFLLNF